MVQGIKNRTISILIENSDKSKYFGLYRDGVVRFKYNCKEETNERIASSGFYGDKPLLNVRNFVDPPGFYGEPDRKNQVMDVDAVLEKLEADEAQVAKEDDSDDDEPDDEFILLSSASSKIVDVEPDEQMFSNFVNTPDETKLEEEAMKEKELGNLAYKAKYFDEAMTHYKAAIRYNPKEITFYSNLAAVFLELEEYKECYDCCTVGLKIGKTEGRSPQILAKLWNRKGKACEKLEGIELLLEAKQCYQEACEADSLEIYQSNLFSVTIQMNLLMKKYCNEGFECEESNKHAEAVSNFSKTILIEPLNPACYFFRASSLINLGKLDEAQEDVEKCLQLGPDDKFGALMLQGAIYRGKGMHMSSKKAYEAALDIKPTDPEAQLEVENQKVEIDFDKQDRKGPYEFAEKENTIGNNYARNKSWKTAVQHYTRSIKAFPKNPKYYCNRAAAFMGLGDNFTKYAFDDLETCLALDPKHINAYLRKGKLHKDNDDLPNAEECYKKVIEIDPTCVTAKNSLLKVRCLKRERMVPLVTEVINDDGSEPNDVAIAMLWARAKAHVENGDFELALKDCEIGVKQMPEPFITYKAQILKKMGDFKNSIITYNELLEIDSGNKEAIKEIKTLKRMIERSKSKGVL